MDRWLRVASLELRRRTEPPDWIIRAAIVYKGIGSVFLVLAAVALLGLVTDTVLAERLRQFLIATALNTNLFIVDRLLIRLGLITRKDATLLALTAIMYGALEGAESFGLANRRRWAEYLTFLATVLLLPPEVYELLSRFSAPKLLLFVANVALAAYLVAAKRLFRVRGQARAQERAGLVPGAP